MADLIGKSPCTFIHAQQTTAGPELPLRLPAWCSSSSSISFISDISSSSSSTSSSSFQHLRPPQTSLMYTLPLKRLRDILAHVAPSSTLAVEDLPSTRLPRLYTLSLDEEKQLLLSVAPSLSVRLLRQEQALLTSEATLVNFLESTVCPRESTAAAPSLPADESRGSILKSVVPKLLKHSSNTREIGYPYSIFDVSTGVPLSSISIYLSLPEQRTIDKQIGSLVRDLALITSPSGKFGIVPKVCGNPFAGAGTAGPTAFQGSTEWLPVFMSLVEGILRDGEDMRVVLPYEAIRAHFVRLSWRLGAVTVPRLLVLDVGDATNILVERGPEEERSAVRDGRKVREGIKLTGLRNWSNGMFGDPLLSSCFDTPSEEFMTGWCPESSDDLIEDEEGGRARLLLYKCYRAIVEIVTGYYRPQADSGRRELESRRKLTCALVELQNIDVDPEQAAKRGRSSTTDSGVEDVSKRPRVSEKGYKA